MVDNDGGIGPRSRCPALKTEGRKRSGRGSIRTERPMVSGGDRQPSMRPYRLEAPTDCRLNRLNRYPENRYDTEEQRNPVRGQWRYRQL
jgi:hypothetical protein